MPPALELEGVGVRFASGPELLSDIGLALAAGSVTVVTAPPGAGKSLLIGVAALACRPSRGAVHMRGERVDGLAAAPLARLRRRIGLADAEPALVRGLDPVDNVALPLRLGGMPRGAARAHAEELLAWLGGVGPSAVPMSPADRRRIGLARAIVADPRLVLVDDADRLDPDALERLPMLVERLGRQGTAFLVTSGDERLGHRFPGAIGLRLEGGRLEGGRLRPIDRPAAPFHPPRA